jgi:hypothetical protein
MEVHNLSIKESVNGFTVSVSRQNSFLTGSIKCRSITEIILKMHSSQRIAVNSHTRRNSDRLGIVIQCRNAEEAFHKCY